MTEFDNFQNPPPSIHHDDIKDKISTTFSTYKLTGTRASYSVYSMPRSIRLAVLTLTGCVFIMVLCITGVYQPQSVILGISVTLAEKTDSTHTEISGITVEEAKSKLLVQYHKGRPNLPGSGIKNKKTLKKALSVDLKDIEVNSDDLVTDIVTRDGLVSSTEANDSIEGETDTLLQEYSTMKKVLLLTYFRGGSTFLGEAFNQNDDAFYWFEPLAAPMFAYKRTYNTKDYKVDDEGQVIPRPKDLMDNLTDITEQILDCDFENLDITVLKHYFATNWRKSANFKKYQQCLSRYKVHHAGELSDKAVTRCKKFLELQCMDSNLRVIKSIRLFVEEALPVIHKDPDVKLVYYIRDPRGVLLSRWSLIKMWPIKVPMYRVEQAAAYICAKMQIDLETAKMFKERYPDKIIMLRYEDLATNPLDTLSMLYNFLGLNLPEDVATWLHYATHAHHSDGSIGTIRSNATAVAERWQTELSPEILSAITGQCQEVIDMFYSSDFFNPW